MKITWIGHSCFKVSFDNGDIVIDPYKDVPGLKDTCETADMVLCSHEHFDHNYREGVTLTGRSIDGITVNKIETYHDEVKGGKRGENIIYIINDGNFKIVHFGDLGCQLTEEQLALLKDVDVAMIPVGGFFTIDAKEAVDILKKIKPKKVIPMHFRDDVDGFGFDQITEVKSFLELTDDMEVEVMVPQNLK